MDSKLESMQDLGSEFLCLLNQIGRFVLGGNYHFTLLMVNGKPFSGKGRLIKLLPLILGDEKVTVVSLSSEIDKIIKGRPDELELKRRKRAGRLMPDEVAVDAFFNAMVQLLEKDLPAGHVVVVDGLPRTGRQLREVYSWVQSGLMLNDCLIVSWLLTMSDETAFRRLANSKRLRDRGGREDDEEDLLRTRLGEWADNSMFCLDLPRLALSHFDTQTEDSGLDIRPEVVLGDLLEKSTFSLRTLKVRLDPAILAQV